MSEATASSIWNASGWPAYYEGHRGTTAEIYPSEWIFLKELLAERMSILDIGCAVGGLASVASEHLREFDYTGVDISPEMIRRARERHPARRFHVVAEADLSVLLDSRFDLVVCLGVLHLTASWRDLMRSAWERTTGTLLLDLRESPAATMEDVEASYFRVDHLLEDGRTGGAVLPYNVINCGEALATVIERCHGAARITHYGYLAPPSGAAVTPAKQLLMNTYRVDR